MCMYDVRSDTHNSGIVKPSLHLLKTPRFVRHIKIRYLDGTF